MDSRSHIEFARRLLKKENSIEVLGALFPQIDRQPAVLHRNFAHHLNKAIPITRDGLACLSGIPTDGGTKNPYVLERLQQEKSRIVAYIPEVQIPVVLNENIESGALVGFVSHLYLDTFNQPVQAFTPHKSNCAGQFLLWDKIGDFRYQLYVEGAVEALRKDWLKSSIWNTSYSHKDLLYGMTYRLGVLADIPTEGDLFQKTIRSLGLNSDNKNLQTIAWLQEMEHELSALHIRHLG